MPPITTARSRNPVSVTSQDDGTWAVTTPSGLTTYSTWIDAQKAANTESRKLMYMIKAAPSWMIQRRLQSLAAAGWSVAWVAKKTRLAASEVSALTTGAAATISPTTCRRIKDVYAVAMRRSDGGMIQDGGPTDLAREHGWAPPAMWDDIDDPNEEHNERVPLDDELHHTLRVVIADAGSDRKAWVTTGISTTMMADMKMRRCRTMSPTVAARVRGMYDALSAERREELAESIAKKDRQRKFDRKNRQTTSRAA